MFKGMMKAGAFAGALAVPFGDAAWAEIDPGAYLAARQADTANDFAVAARYYGQSLRNDPGNAGLQEAAILSNVAIGEMARAAELAESMRDSGYRSQLAHLVLMAQAAKSEDWDAIFSLMEQDLSVSPLVDGLAQSWALVGQGNMTRALSSFDEVIEGEGMRIYGLYHKALALASVGDFEAAVRIFEDDMQGNFTSRAAIAHMQILSQLERNADAIALMQSLFGDTQDPRLVALRGQLEGGERVAFDVAPTPARGIGEISHMIAGLLRGEAADRLTLQYARIGSHLDPDNTDALMLSASLLQQLGRFDLANDSFAAVAQDDPAYPAAELGRIDALRSLGRADAAIEVAQALTRSHPDMASVHAKLGDVLRREAQFDNAISAYSAALDLYPSEHPRRWIVLYTRAIARHAVDAWPEAEADFRAALDLRPNQPQVLNYLGYSLVERGEKLDEALQMIETAVAAEPDNGAIVDSLGWVLFQLGRYEEAVDHMERAASLEAVDPIVNDHLGDVYWAVGRQTEAVFQWNRALSLDPEEELATRIRAKLERGLDAVLAEEGAAPIDVARDDG